MVINYFNQTELNTTDYEKIINKIFKKKSPRKYINFIFVSSQEIQEINRTYRNIDKVTDVISFANCDGELIAGSESELGDVFICLTKAFDQALEYQHSVSREIGFLAVHGYLHLLGYDHLTKEDELEMFSLQDEILKEAKLERR